MPTDPRPRDDGEGLAGLGLIAPGVQRPIPWDGPKSVVGLLDAVLARDPAREAVVGTDARLDYGELELQVNRAAAALVRMGVRPGDRVVASTANCVALVIAFLATMRLGAVWAGVNRQLAGPEKRFAIEDVAARVVLADERALAELAVDRDVFARVVDAEPSRPSDWSERCAAHDGATRPSIAVDPFAPAAISFTSGTTGQPKGAVHSQHNMMVVVARGGALRARVVGRKDMERRGVCLPLTLLNLVILGPLAAFAFGHTCVVLDRVDPVGMAGWIERERVQSMALVPTQLHDLLTHPDVDPTRLAPWFRPGVGGADCPPAWRARFAAAGFPVGQGYGLTEAPTAVTAGAPDDPPGTSGRALPHVRVVAVDEATGRELGPDEVGEVCVGPTEDGPYAHVYTPMLGYWGRPEESARALRGGLLHTGDLGSIDADGFLTIHDRADDLVIRGGANVSPAEVERVLVQDPRVTAAAVLGVPDERLGQTVVAAVQLAAGASASEAELRARCAAELARYKVPDRILVVDDLPRTAMGKVLRRSLRPRFEPSTSPHYPGTR